MSLLGYTGADGAVNGAQSAELFRRGLNIVNQVMADIWPLERKDAYIPLSNINDDIPLSQYAVESAILYGVAMFLAQSEGDGENQQFYSSLYQQKRNAAKRRRCDGSTRCRMYGRINMRIPKMQASPQYRVTIPKLDGGVNLKDAPHLVEDNQLTNVCNMWWQDQALRTRPGLKTEINSIYRIETNERVSCSDGVLSSIGGCPAMAVFSRINMGTVLVSVYKIQPDGGREQVGNPIYLPTDEDVNSLRIMFVESDKKASGNGLYIFFNVGLIFEWNGSDEWAQLSDDDMYVPTVLVSGKGTYTDGEVGEPNGTFFEGYNMLTGRFRSLYTTDGKGKTFWLPQKGLDNSKITAKYTDSKGTVHTHTINANTSMETAAQADGLVLMADRTAGYVYFTKDRVSPTPVPSANITNNLEVVASKDRCRSL